MDGGKPDRREHGGDLAAARARFGDPSEGWLDLSTGINPIPYPVPAIPADAWTRLPDARARAALEETAATSFGASDSAHVVAAPGTQALIQLLPRLVPARRVAILGFTYAEHAACWRAAGAEVATVDSLEAAGDADVVVIVNPNNPDGRVVPAADLVALAERMAARRGVMVVDEAFADLTPAMSVIPTLPTAAVVLRSFGKTYGLAGARLGFAVADAAFAERVRAALGPWPVAGPTLVAAMAAYGDAGWRAASAARLKAECDRMDALARRAGFAIVGGSLYFRLYDHADAAAWHARLGRRGILTRAFAERSHWLRLGLPGDAAGWDRLEAALGAEAAAIPGECLPGR
jgi:cobalamin biosynthetic protein CobC